MHVLCIHKVILFLQVLALMCDGQYRLMQNYLREQKDNIVSINIVGEVALSAQVYICIILLFIIGWTFLF